MFHLQDDPDKQRTSDSSPGPRRIQDLDTCSPPWGRGISLMIRHMEWLELATHTPRIWRIFFWKINQEILPSKLVLSAQENHKFKVDFAFRVRRHYSTRFDFKIFNSFCHWPVIKDETLWTPIFKDGVVILILIELHAPVEPAAVLGVAVVSLSAALQHSLRILPDALDLTLSVNYPHDAEWWNMQTWNKKKL